jgi:hypothetical protein
MAIAREPLAAEWEGPILDKSFPTNAECARAVLVSVVERGPQLVADWSGANGVEREQLAERVALESEILDLLRHGKRPITDEERSDTVRSAKALTTTVLDRIAAAANSHSPFPIASFENEEEPDIAPVPHSLESPNREVWRWGNEQGRRPAR